MKKNPGAYTKSEKQKVFISLQTYEGVKINVHSVIDLVKFLIMHKVSYVLTERFCQDPLENYFDKQRSLGAFTNISHPSMTLVIMTILSETKTYSNQ